MNKCQILAAALCVYCQAAFAQTLPEISITATQAHYQTHQTRVSLIGFIKGKELSVIQAKASGQVDEIKAFVGDKVKKGALLLSLKETDEKIKLEVARSSFAKAEAAFELEALNYQRAKALYQSKAISLSKFQLQKLNFQTMKSDLKAAEVNLKLAKLKLAATQVRSPIDGVVFERKVHAHSLVAPGDPLYIMSSPNNLRAVIPVPMKLVANVKEVQLVRLENTINGKKINGTIVGSSPIINQQTHSADFYVDFENLAGFLPGQTVIASLVVKEEQAVALPQQAIVYKQGYPEIYVITNQKAEGVRVDVSLDKKGLMWVTGKIQEGALIAVRGAVNLYNGVTVRVEE